MIEFTIKTLDSNNHHFSVDDGTTVQQLKEKVREQMGIDINLQRLIFCGRVMQDERKLSDYDVNGKVVHLVQRAPPCLESRGSTSTSAQNPSNGEGSNPSQQQIRRLMSLAGTPGLMVEEQASLSLSPTIGRLELIRSMISEIKAMLNLLQALENGEDSTGADTSTTEAHVGNMETDTAAASNEENDPVEEHVSDSPDFDPIFRSYNARRRTTRALRAQHSRPRDLGQLLDELEQLSEQFAPYRANYIGLLRSAYSPDPPQFSDEERHNTQRMVDTVTDIMHSFAHAYHAVSDIHFKVGQRIPRLTSEFNLMRHPIPVHAHINVVQAERRPGPVAREEVTTSASGNWTPSGDSPVTPPEDSPATPGTASATSFFDSLPAHVRYGDGPVVTHSPHFETLVLPRGPGSPVLHHHIITPRSTASVGVRAPNATTTAAPRTATAPAAPRNATAPSTREPQSSAGAPEPQTSSETSAAPPNAAATNTVTTNTAATNTATSNTASTNTATSNAENPEDNSAGQSRNCTQSAVNINIQPEPVTYQVEIETRVPIAIALENALFNGLSNNARNARNQRQAQREQGDNADQEDETEDPAQRQGQDPNQAQGQAQAQDQGQQGQAAAGQQGQNQRGPRRRQILFDFENLFESLGPQASLGGVEVVMSMEEIPQGAGLPNRNADNTNNVPNAPNVSFHNLNEGVFLAPMPWGGPASADLLQTLVTSVIRQGLVPGIGDVEGVAVQLPRDVQVALAQAHNNQAAAAAAAAATGDAAAATAAAAAAAGVAGAPGAAAGTDQPTGEAGARPPTDPNNQARQSIHVRRATSGSRAASLSMNSFVYDRYLQCESASARRRLQRRREVQQQQQAELERARADRLASRNIEALHEHSGISLTQENMQTMETLLNSAPSQEAWLNAILVTIARQLFLPEALANHPGEPVLVPNEFQRVRTLLRNYMLSLLTVTRENAFLTISDHLVDSVAPFITRVREAAAIRDEIDVVESIRNLFRTRLPPVIASILSEYNGDSIAARFYSVCAGLFGDVCTMIAQSSRNHEGGLIIAFRTYMRELVEPFSPAIQNYMQTLAMDILTIVIRDLPRFSETIQQFIQFKPNEEEPTPMEVSPEAPPPPPEEPMQSSPPSQKRSSPDNDEAPEAKPSSSTVSKPVSPDPSPSVRKEKSPNKTPEQSVTSSPQRASNSQIPPKVIVQNWDEQWARVISCDAAETQRRAPAEPYSDAYLAGMPSRKRRCLRQARPNTTVEGLMTESLRDTSDRQTQTEGARLLGAFREHVRMRLLRRATTSDDYTPARYVAAGQFLDHAAANPDEQVPESSNDSNNA